MATFKIKDLMINLGDRVDLQCVLHTTQTCNPTFHCFKPSFCPYATWHCKCPTLLGASYPTPTIVDLTTPVQNVVSTPEEIQVLREQLKEQLALLDQQEKIINEELRPKTLAEVNLIEEKLKE
jgi:hypothetical protein